MFDPYVFGDRRNMVSFRAQKERLTPTRLSLLCKFPNRCIPLSLSRLVVYIVQTVTLMLTQDLVWILEAVMHANYLFLLVGVSILWRPNSHAKGKKVW
jgi:hypothetical protein